MHIIGSVLLTIKRKSIIFYISPNQYLIHMPINIQRLSIDIFKGKYTLVIGDDVILKKEFANGNSRDYIRQKYTEEFGETLPEYGVSDTAKAEFSRWADGINYDIGMMNPNIVKLLQRKCFRIVIVTTFDLYVETVLKKVWGDKLEVVNFFNPEELPKLENLVTKAQVPPILVYAFGRPSSEYELDYVCGENDKMNLVARWFGDDRPKNFINFLADCGKRDRLERNRILAVGCKFDDWFFRFFWYCLRQDITNLRGDVAISLGDDDVHDKKLVRFMGKNLIEYNHDSNAFLEELCPALENVSGIYSHFVSKSSDPDVFISYAHEDFNIVCQIYDAAKRLGYGVWFDDAELNPGDDVREKAHDGIDSCKVFMPILSEQTKIDLEKGNDGRYYFKEWNRSRNNKNCIVLPVVLSGFHQVNDIPLLEKAPEGSLVHWIKPDSDDGMAAIKVVNWGAGGKNELAKGLRNVFEKLKERDSNGNNR